MGSWYTVIKTIKGYRYVYEQRTWREGKNVRTESRYIGPAGDHQRSEIIKTKPKTPQQPPPLEQLVEEALTAVLDVPAAKRADTWKNPFKKRTSLKRVLVKKIQDVDTFIDDLDIQITNDTGRAYFNLDTQSINIPPANTFRKVNNTDATHSYYSTFFHEIIHWSGHRKRLDRYDNSELFKFSNYCREELVAEFGAVMLTKHFLIKTDNFDQSAIYFLTYLKRCTTGGQSENEILDYVIREAKRAVTWLLDEQLTLQNRRDKQGMV